MHDRTCLTVGIIAGWLTLSSWAPAVDRPNFIIFLTDDLGYGDLGCFGHPIIKTPNLDAFAKQGARFLQCYSASPVCSPSRSAIMTGRTPYRTGVFTAIPEESNWHLRPSEVTIAKRLQASGYATAHIGKWHLNGYFNNPRQPQPSDHGFDFWMSTQNNAAPSHRFPENFVRNGTPVGPTRSYSAIVVVDQAIQWLRSQRDQTKPFFLCVWTHEPHYPIAADEPFKAQYPDLTDAVQKEHHACVTQMDHAFGKLMKSLDEQRLTDDTLVFFTADNGPEGDGVTTPGRGSAGGLRGRKRAVYEGGIRVPSMIRWPGKAAVGAECNVPVIGSDIGVTIGKIAGAELPTDRVIDGGDFRSALAGQPVERARPLFWRSPIGPSPFRTAMRVGDWKIVADDPLTQFELYHIGDDPKETTNLASTKPVELGRLKQQLMALNREIEAEGPTWWKEYEKERADAAAKKATKKAAKKE